MLTPDGTLLVRPPLRLVCRSPWSSVPPHAAGAGGGGTGVGGRAGRPRRMDEIRMLSPRGGVMVGPRSAPFRLRPYRTPRTAASGPLERAQALHGLHQAIVRSGQRDPEKARSARAVGVTGRDDHPGFLQHVLAVGGSRVKSRG